MPTHTKNPHEEADVCRLALMLAATLVGSDIADGTDDGAASLAAGTFDMSAAQAQTSSLHLGSLAATAPTAPVLKTVAV